MTENEIMTRDIHNFVRGHMNFEQGLELIEMVSESEEWIDHLLYDIYLFEMAISHKRGKLTNDLNLNKSGVAFYPRLVY